MTDDRQEQGWTVSVPRWLLNPLVWIVIIVVVGFGGYKLLTRSGEPMTPATDAQTSTQSTSSSQPVGYFKKVSETPVSVDNKPYFLFIGGQFCPFCAAERWSIVKALSNFGTWSGLEEERSAEEEAGFSGVPTYNFLTAEYESQYISFAHKESADRNGKPIPGQELSDFEQQWVNQYNPRGGIPFLFIGGKYVQLSSGFSPNLLAGNSYQQVKRDVDSNANVDYANAIDREADILTAYLCKATGNQPSAACTDPTIKQMISQIP